MKMRQRAGVTIIASLLYITINLFQVPRCGAEPLPRNPLSTATFPGQWPAEVAWQWYEKVGPIRGFNYDPSYAVNDIAFWDPSTFNVRMIERELSWARNAGYNSTRIFLPYLEWKNNPRAFRRRVEQVLAVAQKNGISVTPVLLVAGNNIGHLGQQEEPIPGVHNSRAVQWPGSAAVIDQKQWAPLKRFIQDIVRHFRNDRRILMWDMYNEPDNADIGERCLPLLQAAFVWAREVQPSQPLTAPVWHNYGSAFANLVMIVSDVVTFHNYDSAEQMEETIKLCRKFRRPIICTEWLRRQVGNTFIAILPVFSKYGVGWYNWGLVAGRTQTYMWWESKVGDPIPSVWQHDVMKPDGLPYDPEEINLIKKWNPTRDRSEQ